MPQSFDPLEIDARDVWDLVSDAIYAIGPDWRFTYLNPAAARGAGGSAQDLLGRHIWEHVPGAVGSDLWQAHQDVMATREPRQLRTYSRAAARLVQAHLRPLSGGGLVVVLQDVEAQERTQAQLSAAEAERAASDRLLRELTDAMPALIAYVDGEQRFRFANKAYEARFNRPLGEIIGRTLAEVFGASTYEARRPYVERALQGEPQLYEVPFNGPEGEIQTLVQHVPARDLQGRVVGFYALVQDITPLRSAEAALRESEARLELATKASALGIWEWRLDDNAMIFSARAKEIWGFRPDEDVTFQAVYDRTHPEDRAEVSAQSARAFDPVTREQRPYRYRIRRPDGQVRWVKAHGEAVFRETADGPRAVRYVGTMEDVTEQHALQEELSRSEARLRLAADAGRMAVWAVDGDGCVAHSPELNRIVGLPIEATPTLEELRAQYYPGELERLQALANETLQRGDRYFEAEYRHIRASDAAVRWLMVRAEFQVDPEGAPAGWLGVVLDITERREAEDRLRLLAREVDHRANNLLTVVQSAIALSGGSTLEDYRDGLKGRVSALARAHQLLASSRWTGADLRTLVLEELQPYSSKASGRIAVDGPPLALDPATAQGVAMVIHELATNAVKHGALAAPEGAIRVSWTPPHGERMCALHWEERGAPPIKRGRTGLGMQVIERALAGSVGGGADLDWRPEGLHCRLTFKVAPSPAELEQT